MIGNVPPKPTGNSPEAVFMRWVYDRLMFEARPQDVTGQLVSRTARGFIVHGGGGDGLPSSTVRMYHLKSVESDYLVCRTWDGTVPVNEGDPNGEGTSDVYIAKQYKHRNSLESETMFSILHTYTYGLGATNDANNMVRTDSPDGGTAEDQMIVPPWLVNDVIYAVRCSNTGVTRTVDEGLETEREVPITLIHCCDSRQWAKIRPY